MHRALLLPSLPPARVQTANANAQRLQAQVQRRPRQQRRRRQQAQAQVAGAGAASSASSAPAASSTSAASSSTAATTAAARVATGSSSLSVGSAEEDNLPIALMRHHVERPTHTNVATAATIATATSLAAPQILRSDDGDKLDPDGDVFDTDDDDDGPCTLVDLLKDTGLRAAPNTLTLPVGTRVAVKFEGTGWELGRVRQTKHRHSKDCPARCSATTEVCKSYFNDGCGGCCSCCCC